MGFVFLSLSLKRHYLQVCSANNDFLRWRLLNRIAGYALVTLSLLPCMVSNSPGVGLVLWLSILAAAAFLQAMLLTYWPKRCLMFSAASMVLIIVGILA